MTTYADHHKIYLGIWQSQTLTYVIAPNNPSNNYIMPITDPNAGAFQTSTNDWYLETDPAKNTSMLDLNGMAVSPDTARYGIMDGSLDLGGQQRLTTSTAIKGKHGEDFGDYHFTNREIKFQLRVNCRDASNNVNIDIGLAAIQKISSYINNAYQSHIYRTHRTGQAPTPGQPIVLAVMLAGSTKWVYFDIIGGFVSTKTTFDTIDWSTGQITIEVTLVAKYSAKGDFVWLSNAVIDGNFTGYSRGWSGSYTTHDDTSATTLTMGNLVPTYATVGNGATITSQTRVVTQGSKSIFSMYYQCTDTTTVITATIYTIKMGSNSYNNVGPYNSSTNPSGYVATQIKSFTLPNNFSGTYTSTPFYIFDGQSGPGYSIGFTNVYVVLSFSSMTAASVALNQVALWTWPPFVQNPVAPTEYLNVIPDPRFGQGTKVYNVRGDIESEALITVEPSDYVGDASGNSIQTVSIGMRQVKGKAIPVFHSYGTNTTSGSTNTYAFAGVPTSGTTNITTNANNTFKCDRRPRTYKLYFLGQTPNPFGVTIIMHQTSGTYLVISSDSSVNVLPSANYPYLAVTGTTKPEYLLDMGVLTIPNGSVTASPAALNYSSSATFSMNFNLSYLNNYYVPANGNTVQLYGLFMLPADQFFYCDLKNAHAYGTTAIWIDSLSGIVQCTLADNGGVFDVLDSQAQFTNAALRLYPSNGNYRTASSSVSGSAYPITIEDTMPTEIVVLPRQYDPTETDHIAKLWNPYTDYNGTVASTPKMYDNLVSVGYYPRYIDFSSTAS